MRWSPRSPRMRPSLADLTFSNPNGLVEAARPGVSKATGLAQIATELGVDAV